MREQETLAWKRRRKEQGQTILLVVVSLVSLLGMAALAIDVVTLFVAHTEIQRAADAAALAGAKAIADSGYTTDTTVLAALPTAMAAQVIGSGGSNGVLQENLVGGRPPQVVSAVPNLGTRGNPTITVTLQQTNLPTFFARIWGRRLATVSATAMAEAYNPSGSTTPIAPQCVKPWFIANKNPNNAGTAFINVATGAVNPGVGVGDPFQLRSACTGSPCVTFPFTLAMNTYLPALVPAGSVKVGPPASCTLSGSDYVQGVAGCDATPYSCGGSAITNATADNPVIDPGTVGGDTENGVNCLIHADAFGLGQGQDTFDKAAFPADPMQIKAGSNNPLIGGAISVDSVVTTSSSVVTIPIIDTTGPVTSTQVKVIGFVQAFIDNTGHVGGVGTKSQIDLHVLNVSGCGTGMTTPPPGPVSAGGVSPIPVRLIHQ